jgi:hypothetical protein
VSASAATVEEKKEKKELGEKKSHKIVSNVAIGLAPK